MFLGWVESSSCEEGVNRLVGNRNAFNLIQFFCEVFEIKALIVMLIQSYNFFG